MPRPWSKSTLISPSDITPEDKILSRRALLAGGFGIAMVQAVGIERGAFGQDTSGALAVTRNPQYSATEAANSFKDISTSIFYPTQPTACSKRGNQGIFSRCAT